MLALAIHCGLIALGYYIVTQPVAQYQAPQLILPKGWATEFEGSASTGATPLLQSLPPVTIAFNQQPAPTSAVESLGVPPGDLQNPSVSAPALVIDSSRGTAEQELLPSFKSEPLPPVNLRGPPIASAPAEINDTTGGATSAASINTNLPNPSDASEHATGSAQSGVGDGSGGGTQGVPEGMPIPSIRNKIPPYPSQALRNGWTGTVVLELTISSEGRVAAARILQSSSYDILDQSALETARTWHFSPARLNGRPVALTVSRPINFEQQK